MMRSSRVLVVVGCVILALVFPLMVLSGDIGVVNGGFETLENPIQGWTFASGYSAEVTADAAHGGSYSFHATCTENCPLTTYYQAIDVSLYKGQTLMVTGWLYYPKGAECPSGESNLEAKVIQSGSCTTALGGTTVGKGEDTPAGAWKDWSAAFLVPSTDSATTLCIYLVAESNTLHFDDISVTSEDTTAVEMTGLRGSSGVWALVVLEVAVALVLIAGLSRKMG